MASQEEIDAAARAMAEVAYILPNLVLATAALAAAERVREKRVADWCDEHLDAIAEAALRKDFIAGRDAAAAVAEARDLSIMSSTAVDIEARKIAVAIRALEPPK